MNDPQFWGAVRGVLIALGGAVAAYGIMSAAEWTVLINHGMAIMTALAGLVAIVWPMYQGYRSRSKKALLVTAGDLPGVDQIVMNTAAAADAVPSPKVVGPAGA